MSDTTPGLCTYLWNRAQIDFWHLIWLKISLLKTRRTIQDSVVGVLTYLINEVVYCVEDLTTAVGRRTSRRVWLPKGWALLLSPVLIPLSPRRTISQV